MVIDFCVYEEVGEEVIEVEFDGEFGVLFEVKVEVGD